MTENEVIEYMEELNKNYFQPDKLGEFDDVNEAFEVAIKALEEIQQYRELGTVRQIKDFIADWRKFRDLGNLEELREATEKQRAKKPKEKIELLADISFGMAPCRSYYCQKCGGIIKEWSAKYCSVCGQAIDWSDEV